jgi:tetratricopeptide (TPR) repeat protein
MHHDHHIFLQKRLESAEGYLMLEMDEDAWSELEDISVDDLPKRKDKALYLSLVLELAMRAHDWELGRQIAEALAIVSPENPNAYVHGAFCLHELGKTNLACALLMTAPSALREVPLYHYNLGCYHAVLGDRNMAMLCLKEAFDRDPGLKSTARKDPDLKGLGKFLY